MHNWFPTPKPGSLLLLLCCLSKASSKEGVHPKRNNTFNPWVVFFFLFLLGCQVLMPLALVYNRIVNQRQMFQYLFLKYPWGLHQKGCLWAEGEERKRDTQLCKMKIGRKGKMGKGKEKRTKREENQGREAKVKREIENYWKIRNIL